MWHDGKEYVVGIREKLCRRARVYYHGSKAACTEAYKILKDAISNPDSQQCTQS